MNRLLLLSALLALALPVRALDLPAFGSGQSRIPEAASLDTALSLTWNGIKARNIARYGNGLVHRPKSDIPGDAVSEGQGYGMLVALLMNDQAAYDSIWDAAETYLLATGGNMSWYNWRADSTGTVIGTGAASDADEDLCLTLIFADSLVKAGRWTAHVSPKGADYITRAQQMLNCLWTDMVDQGKYLRPGQWGGESELDPGYFSPAWYRIFATHDTDRTHAWSAVIDQSYRTILANPGAGLGLLPDWSDGTGAVLANGPGYNAYANGQWFYKDAIRVHWRLALDWIWNAEPRAKRFLDKGYAFIAAPADANFFQLDGVALPDSAPFPLDGGAITRPRSEHSHLTTGMWGCTARAEGLAQASPWARELLSFHTAGADYWGHATDPDGEDTLHNEMYFDQFLAWFGGAVLSNRFANVLEELADPNPSLPLAWSRAPAVAPVSVDFQNGALQITGHLDKVANWTVAIVHRDSGTSWTASGRSDSIALGWTGQSTSGAPFPQGWVGVTFSAYGLPDTTLWAWVSHQKDLRADSAWLIVDSCREAGLSPNFGNWQPFNNSAKGGTSTVSLALAGTGADRGLAGTYNLGTGGYQYGGIEWNALGWTGFAAATKVRFRAKADHPTVVDFYVVESDITDDYLHVLDTVGTAWKTFEHAFSTFTPRLGGSDVLNMAKATALNWHIQADKCLSSSTCLTGTLTVGDFVLGGNMAAMYTAPAAAVAMPDTPAVPAGIRPSLASALRLSSYGGALRIEAPTACAVTVRDLSGRMLLRRSLPTGSSRIPVGSTGLLLVEVKGQGWNAVRRVQSLR
jgi:endo-1,4-beta-D-glucanase Y